MNCVYEYHHHATRDLRKNRHQQYHGGLSPRHYEQLILKAYFLKGYLCSDPSKLPPVNLLGPQVDLSPQLGEYFVSARMERRDLLSLLCSVP